MAEKLLQSLARIVWALVRGLLWNVLFEIVIFQLGRLALLALTLGRYPRAEDLGRDANRITCAGIAAIVGFWGIIAVYNNLA